MIQDGNDRHAEIAERLRNTEQVRAALKSAARDAVVAHVRAGLPIVVWRDNQIVWEEVSDDQER